MPLPDKSGRSIEAGITRRCGQGEYIPEADHMLFDFTEWHSGAQTIRLHKFYGFFLFIDVPGLPLGTNTRGSFF